MSTVHRNPNFRCTVILDALDPHGVELAIIEVRASGEAEARMVAEMFLRPEASIQRIDRISYR